MNGESGIAVDSAIRSELQFTLSNTSYRIIDLGAPVWNGNAVSVSGASTNGPFDVFINSSGPMFNQTLLIHLAGRVSL